MRLIQALMAAFMLMSVPQIWAQDANLKKNLAERLPSLPKIEEISKTPMTGVFEVRVQGNELFYTDAKGDFLIQGALIDTKQKRNLTEERTDKLSAVSFDSIPLKYAFTQVKGNGKRKLVIFADPNCGYCKRFEKDRAKTWNDWMLQGVVPPATACDNHNIEAIVEFGKKSRINGTPTLFVADGTRVPGAIDAAQVETLLNSVKP